MVESSRKVPIAENGVQIRGFSVKEAEAALTDSALRVRQP